MASLVYNKNNPQLLQDEDAGQTVKYHSSDSEELYNKSVADNWRWKDVNIDYTFNSLGYRTKELAELDKDFLLTFGCSYTEGIGLPNKSIWLITLSITQNLDLYNAEGSYAGAIGYCQFMPSSYTSYHYQHRLYYSYPSQQERVGVLLKTVALD